MVLARFKTGAAGRISSGEGPRDSSAPRDLGRRIVEARRSLLGTGLENPGGASNGAV